MEVIRHAYTGLFQLAPVLFDKYVDFIDVYAEIREAEREELYKDLFEQKETVMLTQYIREKGILQGKIESLITLLEVRFGGLPEWARERIEHAELPEIEKWSIRLFEVKNVEEIFNT